MENNYISNPAIKLLASHVEPGCKEAEVQRLWENVLWTTYPASKGWTTETKHKSGAIEPDNKVSKIVEFSSGWATMELLVVELKRPSEKITQRDFNETANNNLDDFMSESANPAGSTYFGAVGIGLYVQFYSRVLPQGKMVPLHNEPLHLLDHSQYVQHHFEHFRANVPKGLYMPEPAAVPAAGPAADVVIPEQYYYRAGRFYYSSDSEIPLRECPLNVWVMDELGWNSGGGKKWRWRYDDKTHDYRDD